MHSNEARNAVGGVVGGYGKSCFFARRKVRNRENEEERGRKRNKVTIERKRILLTAKYSSTMKSI